jgi:hypothetical protein
VCLLREKRPSLHSLHEEYLGRGLAIIGVFYPEAGRDNTLGFARVKQAVGIGHFKFSVAIDWDWRTKTLKEWWETGTYRSANSVAFILEKAGVIRFVHPGMECHDDGGDEEHAMCVDEMAKIRSIIEQLIAE